MPTVKNAFSYCLPCEPIWVPSSAIAILVVDSGVCRNKGNDTVQHVFPLLPALGANRSDVMVVDSGGCRNKGNDTVQHLRFLLPALGAIHSGIIAVGLGVCRNKGNDTVQQLLLLLPALGANRGDVMVVDSGVCRNKGNDTVQHVFPLLPALGANPRDVMVVNFGLHSNSLDEYTQWLSLFKQYYKHHRKVMPFVIWRETSPQHFKTHTGEFMCPSCNILEAPFVCEVRKSPIGCFGGVQSGLRDHKICLVWFGLDWIGLVLSSIGFGRPMFVLEQKDLW
jgi:hypothetical protein